jgi:hypothetical protein
MALPKKTARKIATKARKFFRARDEGKDAYARADRLLREMRQAGLKPGDAVPINAAGDRVRLQDLYADSDKVFRAHGIGRFELVIDKASQ